MVVPITVVTATNKTKAIKLMPHFSKIPGSAQIPHPHLPSGTPPSKPNFEPELAILTAMHVVFGIDGICYCGVLNKCIGSASRALMLDVNTLHTAIGTKQISQLTLSDVTLKVANKQGACSSRVYNGHNRLRFSPPCTSRGG